jgi:hypothetical protein
MLRPIRVAADRGDTHQPGLVRYRDYGSPSPEPQRET